MNGPAAPASRLATGAIELEEVFCGHRATPLPAIDRDQEEEEERNDGDGEQEVSNPSGEDARALLEDPCGVLERGHAELERAKGVFGALIEPFRILDPERPKLHLEGFRRLEEVGIAVPSGDTSDEAQSDAEPIPKAFHRPFRPLRFHRPGEYGPCHFGRRAEAPARFDSKSHSAEISAPDRGRRAARALFGTADAFETATMNASVRASPIRGRGDR